MSLHRFLVLAICVAVLAKVAPAQSPEITTPRLSMFPNTTVALYDVEGETVTAINRSIRAKRALANGKVVPASTSWAVRADFDRVGVGNHCSVGAATVEMTARAELPRLVGGEKLSAGERARWADYVSLLEQGSAATLAFVYENLGQIETAMQAAGCDNARAAAMQAIEVLRAHADRISADNEKRVAALSEFRPVLLTNSKLICRDLKVSGGRLRTVKTCLPAREWERLWKSSAEYTQEVVAKFSKSPREPF